MNPTTVHDDQNASIHTPLLVVRQAIATLNSLNTETADHLSALAFVLTRVAQADGRVCNDERARMEEILIESARIPAEHAVLVTEIACHRAEIADCGTAYAISRKLRARIGFAHRNSIVGFLMAVANADGTFLAVEHREIVQIARELGIEPDELVRTPSTQSS